ncbi:hypothetical protein H0H87_008830 [Tephrocybe sp. NHM501043]|nr:hypothetical protein H0H87_008830 [Tephrocybe sp. NHM501043]
MRVAKEDYDKAKRTTLKVIERAAKQPPNWNDTYTLRGKETRLASLIKSSPAGRMSREHESFESNTDAEYYAREVEENEAEGTSASHPPGTFVETRRSLIVSYGVVLGEHFVNKKRRMTTLMSNGEVWFPGRQDILYTVPNFVPTDLIERCGDGRSPLNATEMNARIEVLRRLSDLQHTSEVMYNIATQRSDVAYDQVKSADPNAWSTTTISEIADLVIKKDDKKLLFGLHQYIMANPLYFLAHHNYQETGMIFVRPQSHVDDITTVMGWTRRRDSPIVSFVARAQKLMPIYAKLQDLTSAEHPSYERATHSWTDTDQTILRVLGRSLRQIRTIQTDPYSLAVSYIMRQLYPGRHQVDEDIVHRTIVDLGALTPWQDLASLDPMLHVDPAPEPNPHSERQEAIAARSFQSMATSGTDTPLGPEDFYRTDPLDSIRHDFGDLSVFVIDDPTAQELDDGVSIERIPSEPGTYWVHTHVADPASLIPPGHILAKEASRRTTSIYFRYRTWPLLPKSIMDHPQHGLSLSMGRNLNGSPIKVLTFSSKVNSTGDLLDHKVRAGLIRNVKVITYDEADAALGETSDRKMYPFGRKLPPKDIHHTLPETCVKDLQDLKKVADYMIGNRYRAGIIHANKDTADLISIIPPPPEIFGSVSEPLTFRGFPTFEYCVTPAAYVEVGSHSLVAEAMKLACRVASLFCTQNNIPTVRRVSDPRSIRFFGDVKDVLNKRAPNCVVSHYDVINNIEAPPTTGYSMEPKAHYGLGVPGSEGYARVTSPLRRYLDLVAHWQIHHALLGSKAPTPSPPFSAEEVWNISKVANQMETVVRILERNHRRFWQVIYLKRWAHEQKDASHSILNNIRAYTINATQCDPRTGSFQVTAECPDLGLETFIRNVPKNMPAGTEIRVRAQQFVLGTRPQVISTLNNPENYEMYNG